MIVSFIALLNKRDEARSALYDAEREYKRLKDEYRRLVVEPSRLDVYKQLQKQEDIRRDMVKARHFRNSTQLAYNGLVSRVRKARDEIVVACWDLGLHSLQIEPNMNYGIILDREELLRLCVRGNRRACDLLYYLCENGLANINNKKVLSCTRLKTSAYSVFGSGHAWASAKCVREMANKSRREDEGDNGFVGYVSHEFMLHKGTVVIARDGASPGPDNVCVYWCPESKTIKAGTNFPH